MKKIVFLSALFAGTVLGLAKDNVETKMESVSKEKMGKLAILNVLEKQTINSEIENLKSKKKLCHKITFWRTTETHHGMNGELIFVTYEHYESIIYCC